jgi:hypothetical protein
MAVMSFEGFASLYGIVFLLSIRSDLPGKKVNHSLSRAIIMYVCQPMDRKMIKRERSRSGQEEYLLEANNNIS